MKGDNMKKKKNKLDPIGNFVRNGSFSTKWTAFFAVIAIFSVLTLGITKVSFAALDDMPDTLTEAKQVEEAVFTGDWVPHGVLHLKYAMANGVKIPVYCLEVWQSFDSHDSAGATYVKASDITYLDNGVIAILTYANKEMWGKDLQNNIDSTKTEQGITQLAIWLYLYETNPTFKSQAQNNSNSMTDDLVSKMTSNSQYGSTIRKLADYGKNNAQDFADPKIQIDQSGDGFQLDSSQQYMVSPKMTLSINENAALVSFGLALENAPEGTIIDIDGKSYSIDELKQQSFGSDKLGMAIQVKVPKDKVTEESKTFNLKVTSTREYYIGYEYTKQNDPSNRAQRIAAGTIGRKNFETSLPLSVQYKVEVPPTAQNSSLTLYLVGLIVLLSGIGVIYANVKPAKQKQ